MLIKHYKSLSPDEKWLCKHTAKGLGLMAAMMTAWAALILTVDP